MNLEFRVPDHELAFEGAASEAVLTAWRHRIERMTVLQAHCGTDFDSVRDEFLQCLARPEHRSRATVHCAIASLRAR